MPRDHALVALAGLVTATVLAVYKPRALTRYGRRRLEQERARSRAEVGTPALAMSTMAPGRDRAGDSTGRPGSRPGPGDDRAAEAGRGRRRWIKTAGFILGVLLWAGLLRLVLGSGPGDAGGGGGGGHEPGGVGPSVTQQQDPGGGGGHTPPPGIPRHGG